MKKFVTVHPIIYRIDHLGDDNYLVFEKLRLMYIPVTFTYSAKVTGDSTGKKVKITAVVKKMVHIEMNFYLAEENKVTRITEEINFRSFLPVKPVMRKIFSQQHRELFNNIEKSA